MRERLDDLRRRLRASASSHRVARGAAIAAAALTLGVGASAGGATRPDWTRNVERVLAVTEGDLSNAQLARLAPDAGEIGRAHV